MVEGTHTRRTQVERRATTRTALLEATISSLIERGYAGVTTAEIAERAGVTRGAQSHHFSTKAELVTAAVRHLTERLLAERLDAVLESPMSQAGLPAMLDRMWGLYTSPLFAAAMEVWIAARTDADLRAHVAQLERDVNRRVAVITETLLPDVAGRQGTPELLAATTATIRGVALLTFVRPRAYVDREWAAARHHLVEHWREHLRERPV